MGKKTTVEEAFFDMGNGGFNYKIVEVTSERERTIHAPPVIGETSEQMEKRLASPIRVETLHNRRWYFEVRSSHFGSGLTLRIPLGTPVIVEYLIGSLQRVLGRMKADTGKPTDGFEFAFREGRQRMSVSHFDGQKVDFKWPFSGAQGVEETGCDQASYSSSDGKAKKSSQDV